MSCLLEARSLRYAYPGRPAALDGVALSIREGTRSLLLGASGAGKTTLLLHLSGALRPSAGQVLLRGVAMEYDKHSLARWRQQVGFVFQNPDDQLFAPTVLQDVAFGPLNLGWTESHAREASLEALAELGVADAADRPPSDLSFGEKKRVAIAGILAMRPQVYLLDEPTAGLDAASRAAVLRMLDSLHADGATMLIASHDLELAREWADHTFRLENGRVERVDQRPNIDLATKRLVHAQMAVCLGCCCGRTDKGHPPVPVEKLKRVFKENKMLKHVQLTISGCLGPCDLANVVKISSVRGQEWLGNLQTEAEFDLLMDWALRVKAEDRLLPLPAEFDGKRLHPYR
jgi:cobalt/nickel transport system ATP-binding protein